MYSEMTISGREMTREPTTKKVVLMSLSFTAYEIAYQLRDSRGMMGCTVLTVVEQQRSVRRRTIIVTQTPIVLSLAYSNIGGSSCRGNDNQYLHKSWSGEGCTYCIHHKSTNTSKYHQQPPAKSHTNPTIPTISIPRNPSSLAQRPQPRYSPLP